MFLIDAKHKSSAKSLDYYADGRPARHYSVTEPWYGATGIAALCVREDVADGNGGFAPSTNYSMYMIDGAKIVGMVKDNTLFGCPNRQYLDLAPIRR